MNIDGYDKVDSIQLEDESNPIESIEAKKNEILIALSTISTVEDIEKQYTIDQIKENLTTLG